MKNHCLGFVVGLVLLGTTLSLGQLALGQEPSPEIKKIAAKWKENQGRVNNVQYRVEGTVTLAKESLALYQKLSPKPNPVPPAKDAVLVDIFTLVLDFTSQRHRLERQEGSYHLPTGLISNIFSTSMYDGSILWG